MTALTLHPSSVLAKYAAVALQALRQRTQDRALLIGRNMFMVVVLMIFSRLWHALLAQRPGSGRPSDFLWYLAIAEWVTLSQPALYLEIEREVRMGDVAYHLTRPLSYLAFKLCSGFAEMLLGMAVMIMTGVTVAYAITGVFPSDPRALLWALPLGLLAGMLLLMWSAIIGLSAFFLHDCTPVYWIWQKLLFVLGGLFVPLSLYPAWLQKIAALSPFSAILSGPASLVFRADAAAALAVAARLLCWLCITTAVLVLLYRRALHAIELHGG